MSSLERDTSLRNPSCELVTSTQRPILTPHLIGIRFLLCTSTVQFILSVGISNTILKIVTFLIVLCRINSIDSNEECCTFAMSFPHILVLLVFNSTLSTVHIITILVQLIEGFVLTSSISQGSTQYFLDMGIGVYVTQEAAYVFNACFSVFILLLLRVSIYVSWRVWLEMEFLSGMSIWFGGRIIALLSYQWVMYFQIYKLLGLIGYLIKGFASIWDSQWLYFQHQPMHLTITVCICRTIFNLTRLNSNKTLFLTQVTTWLVALWAMLVTLQVLCTMLIALKIWWDSLSWSDILVMEWHRVVLETPFAGAFVSDIYI